MPAEKKGIDFSSGKTEKNLLCSQKVHAYVFPSRKTYGKTICSPFPLPGMRRGFRNYVTSLIPHAREREKNSGEYMHISALSAEAAGRRNEKEGEKRKNFQLPRKIWKAEQKKPPFPLSFCVCTRVSSFHLPLSAWVLLIIFDLHMQIRGVLARRGRKGGRGGGGREQGFYHSRNALVR